jgi:hypothetical protein
MIFRAKIERFAPLNGTWHESNATQPTMLQVALNQKESGSRIVS